MSKKRIEQRLDALEDDEPERDGFLSVIIGGDPDRDAGGYYTWDSEREVYVNDDGHERPPEDAPDSEFDYTLMWGDSHES